MPLYFCIFNKRKFDFIFLESVSGFELFSFILSPKSNLWSAPNECAKSIGKQTTHIASGTKAHTHTHPKTHTQTHTYALICIHFPEVWQGRLCVALILYAFYAPDTGWPHSQNLERHLSAAHTYVGTYMRSYGTHRTWRRHGQNFVQLKFKCCTNLCRVPCVGSLGAYDDDADNDDDDDDDRDNALNSFCYYRLFKMVRKKVHTHAHWCMCFGPKNNTFRGSSFAVKRSN